MARFTVRDAALDGLKIIERKRSQDERGWFSRFFCREELALFGRNGGVAQINHALTRVPGTVRGLHFQFAPHAECKLVSCIKGRVFDVAVDLRPQSPTYLKWHGEILSADNCLSMLIPAGFAHGFQTLVPDCELLYLHDVPYAPEVEGGLNALDPDLAIDWPLPVAFLSERDRGLPSSQAMRG